MSGLRTDTSNRKEVDDRNGSHGARVPGAPTLAHREQFEGSISRFHEYISHNELGLAFEELCAAAELGVARP
jgi:hypothetical protein